MVVRVVLQTNPEGQENLHLLTDPLATVEDCLITSGSWKHSDVKVSTMYLHGDKTMERLLENKEFRSILSDDAPAHLGDVQ